MIEVSGLIGDSVYKDAIEGWVALSEEVPLGHKIRVTFQGLKPKTGYAYKEEGSWLGIRYTWRAMRWWSLLNYNNPLVKLELQVTDKQGKASFKTLWEKVGK